MSAKSLDKKGRWRSKTIAFRLSPEENDLLNKMVKLSGLTKQEYIASNMFNQTIVINGNPRVFIELKKQLESICKELKRIQKSSKIDDDFKEYIKYIAEMLLELNNLKIRNRNQNEK